MKIPRWKADKVIEFYPEASKNNTVFMMRFYEMECRGRKLPVTWENISAIMLEYKPETLVRTRRKLYGSSDKKEIKQQEYIREFV